MIPEYTATLSVDSRSTSTITLYSNEFFTHLCLHEDILSPTIIHGIQHQKCYETFGGIGRCFASFRVHRLFTSRIDENTDPDDTIKEEDSGGDNEDRDTQ